MIKVIKNGKVFTVPNSQFKKFEELGFKAYLKVEIDNEELEADVVENEEEKEVIEKPIAKWTGEELKAFVKENDIDTSGATKVAEVREIVKQYLEG